MFKMLVLDLDGTLLGSDKSVSPENAQAVARAREKGLLVVLATGRPPIGTDQARADLGADIDEYLVTYNGALIQNALSGETLYEHTITPADYLDIAALARSRGLFCYAFDEIYCLTPSMHEIVDWESRTNCCEIRVVDFKQMDPAKRLHKAMVTGTPEQLDQAQAAIPADFRQRFSIIRSAPDLLEFLNPLASKGQAVHELASLLGISREEIICIGDSGNDEDMILYAGLGVAMGNATDAIKAVADYVTRHNDSHGVAHAINKFVI